MELKQNISTFKAQKLRFNLGYLKKKYFSRTYLFLYSSYLFFLSLILIVSFLNFLLRITHYIIISFVLFFACFFPILRTLCRAAESLGALLATCVDRWWCQVSLSPLAGQLSCWTRCVLNALVFISNAWDRLCTST